jgi:mono/diheme cytochrome c family protein
MSALSCDARLRCALLLALASCGAVTPTADSGLRRSDAGQRDSGQSEPLDSRPPAVIAGEALARGRGCGSCHDSSAGILAGSLLGIGDKPVYGPNITPDLTMGVGSWTDEQLIRAVRFGVNVNGDTLCSEMPRWPGLNDFDAVNLVAYLRSVAAVPNLNKANTCTPTAADVVLAGKGVVAESGCTQCHGANLAGVDVPVNGTTSSYPPNLTPDPTGLLTWNQSQIIAALKTGVSNTGALLCETMPRFPKLSADQLTGLASYLKSLSAVPHQSPPTVCESSDGGLPPDGGRGPDAGVKVDAGSTGGVSDGGCTAAAVVISQIYGGGGVNLDSTYNADFVELHNRTGVPQAIGNWAIQYASSTGTNWNVAAIPATQSLAAGAFVLFSLATGAGGAALPGPVIALTPPLNLSSSTGKVALTNSAVPLTGACPSTPNIVDFVGYGAGANCAEGGQAAPPTSVSTAAFRNEPGGVNAACVDSDANAMDFVALRPTPHTGTAVCRCP